MLSMRNSTKTKFSVRSFWSYRSRFTKKVLINCISLFSETSCILGASEWNTGYPSTTTMYPPYGPLQPPFYKPDPTIHIPTGRFYLIPFF